MGNNSAHPHVTGVFRDISIGLFRQIDILFGFRAHAGGFIRTYQFFRERFHHNRLTGSSIPVQDADTPVEAGQPDVPACNRRTRYRISLGNIARRLQGYTTGPIRAEIEA